MMEERGAMTKDTNKPTPPAAPQSPRVEPLPAANPQLANTVIKGGKGPDADKLAK
jgi:hypothetical protein